MPRNWPRLTAVVSSVLLSSCEPTLGPEQLGTFPLCEASSALIVPCSGSDDCLLIGDNEERGQLFLFNLNEQGVDPSSQRSLVIRPEVEISDIEALAGDGLREILIFGSHSRNSVCDPKKARRRYLRVRYDGQELGAVTEIVQSKKISCEGILAGVEDDLTLERLCSAITSAEKAADEVFEEFEQFGGQDAETAEAVARERCGKTAPFNVEGAVELTRSEDREIWLGLRGPLVPAAHPDGHALAVMMRLRSTDEFLFDAAVLVDLGGYAIRDLTQSGEWIFGIAGPPEDSTAEFRYWRFPLADLQPGAMIEPELLGELPSSSEGLAIRDSVAFAVVDGDRGEDSGACLKGATYIAVPLPGKLMR